MSEKAVLVMDMPEKCLECKMLNGSDECILQSDDQNLDANTFDDLMNGCPLKPVPSKKNYKSLQDGNPVKAWGNGWNACIDEILEECKNERE